MRFSWILIVLISIGVLLLTILLRGSSNQKTEELEIHEPFMQKYSVKIPVSHISAFGSKNSNYISLTSFDKTNSILYRLDDGLRSRNTSSGPRTDNTSTPKLHDISDFELGPDEQILYTRISDNGNFVLHAIHSRTSTLSDYYRISEKHSETTFFNDYQDIHCPQEIESMRVSQGLFIGSSVLVLSFISNRTNQGSVFVFYFGAKGWYEKQEIINPIKEANDQFGMVMDSNGKISAIASFGNSNEIIVYDESFQVTARIPRLAISISCNSNFIAFSNLSHVMIVNPKQPLEILQTFDNSNVVKPQNREVMLRGNIILFQSSDKLGKANITVKKFDHVLYQDFQNVNITNEDFRFGMTQDNLFVQDKNTLTVFSKM